MKLLFSTATILLFSSNASFASANIRGASSEEEGRDLAGLVDIIVQLNDDAEAGASGFPPGFEVAAEKRSRAAAVAQGLGLSAKYTYGATIYGFSAKKVPEARLKSISENPLVKSVEIDGTIMLDPSEQDARRKLPRGGNGGGGGDNTVPERTPWGIDRVGSGGPVEGRACVIDTGIDMTNRDLNVASDCFTAFTKGRDAGCGDGNGHGTHVAGTIAAIDNDIDVVGVAPGATVVAIKVLDSRGSGSYSGVIDGIEWAAGLGRCDVVNMSLGGGASNSVDNAVKQLAAAGVKVALAAGNESQDANNFSPARADGENIYTVSAFDESGDFAWFSNFGTAVDIAAPGVAVESLRVGGGTVEYSGTSMAAPHIAGILMYSDLNCLDGVVRNDPDGDADAIAVMC